MIDFNLILIALICALAACIIGAVVYFLPEVGAGREFGDQAGVLFVSVACSGRTPRHVRCGGQCNYGTGLRPCECSCHEPEPEPYVPLPQAVLAKVTALAGKVTRRAA